MEKEKNSSYLICNVISFNKMTGKKRVFSGKISLICTCGKISRKFRLLRKSAAILNDVK